MGLVFTGNPPTFSGDITAEVPTATYSGISSDDANTSINPYTGQGPGAGGAGQTTEEVEAARNPPISSHFYGSLIDEISGTVYFVATTGNDSNDGSEESPFLTMQKAVTTASSDDGIVVGDGTTAIDTDDNWDTGVAVGSGFLDDYNKSLSFFGTPNSTILDADGLHADRDHHCAGFQNTGSKVYGIIFTTDPGARSSSFSKALFGSHSANAVHGEFFNCVFSSTGSASIMYDNSATSTCQFNNCSFTTAGSWVEGWSGCAATVGITDSVFTGTPIFTNSTQGGSLTDTNVSTSVTLDGDWHSDTLDSTRGVYSGTNAWS